MDEYEQMEELLERLESGSRPSASSTVDISRLVSAKPEARDPSEYERMVDMIGSLSGRRQLREEQAQPRAASPTHLQVGMEKAQRGEEEMARQAGAARSEIEGALRHLNFKRPKPFKIRKVRESDLVLPGLPIADQIGELEKIITGLKERAFSPDQLEVVGEELYGLRDAVKRERQQGQDVSLLNVRSERLGDAISELEGMMVASSGR